MAEINYITETIYTVRFKDLKQKLIEASADKQITYTSFLSYPIIDKQNIQTIQELLNAEKEQKFFKNLNKIHIIFAFFIKKGEKTELTNVKFTLPFDITEAIKTGNFSEKDFTIKHGETKRSKLLINKDALENLVFNISSESNDMKSSKLLSDTIKKSAINSTENTIRLRKNQKIREK